MTAIFFSYLLYNILAGVVLSISYYRTEGRIVNSREFFLLMLFPAVGLGKWRHNQKVRLSEELEFPAEWFTWNYMIKVNWVYIALTGVLFLVALIEFDSFFGSGNRGSGQGYPGDMFIDLFAAFGMLLLVILLLLAAAFSFGLLFLVLIFIPKMIVKNIETQSYKQRYLYERSKNQEGDIP